MKYHLASSLAAVAAVAACTADTVAVSDAYTYPLDTCASPRFVKTSDELGEFAAGTWRTTWQTSDTVTLTAPDGTVQTLVADAASAGFTALTPDAGGVWTLCNASGGTFEIAVRHSLFGTEGDGTAANPLKVVDEDEISALDVASLTEGFHIELCGPGSVGLGSLSLGEGLVLVGVGDSTWRVATAPGDGVAAVGATVVWRLDSRPSPLAVKTDVELAEFEAGSWRATWRAGDTVTLTAPDGTARTLVADAASVGSAVLEFNAGGLWALTNTVQGNAAITVRHSFFGPVGEGTEASPARLVDEDELCDLASAGMVGDGFVFLLQGAPELRSNLSVPSGFRVDETCGDARLRLAASQDGCVATWGRAVFALDGKMQGPDRRVFRGQTWPVAYCGDLWRGDDEANSVLTVVSPSGAMAEHSLSSFGSMPVNFGENGCWTLTLTSGDKNLTSSVMVIPLKFSMIFR